MFGLKPVSRGVGKARTRLARARANQTLTIVVLPAPSCYIRQGTLTRGGWGRRGRADGGSLTGKMVPLGRDLMARRRKLYEGKAKVLYQGPEPGTLIQYFKDDATAYNNA